MIDKDNIRDEFLNKPMVPPAFPNDLFTDPLSAALDEISQKPAEYTEYAPPPNYTEQLNRLNRCSEDANEELRAVNSKLDHAKEEIKALNETVEQLRCELDEERKRAKQAEKKAQIIAFVVAVIGAALSGATSVFFSRIC